MRTLWLVIRETATLFGSQRKLWLPFLVVALMEMLFLGVFCLAVQHPFSNVLAPPIRFFFGERVLHYPFHLWFLYHVMKHTHLISSILIGAFMSGIACAMVRQRHEGAPLSLRSALVSRQVRYGTVVALWVITWVLAKVLMGTLLRFAPQPTWGLWGGVGLAVLLQALVVYAIPVSVFEGAKWWKALILSLREALHHPITTLAIVAIPSAVMFAFALFASPNRLLAWMAQTAPEIAVVFIFARLVVWTAADAAMTVGIAHLWLLNRAPRCASKSVALSAAMPCVAHGATLVEEGHAVA